MVMIGMVSAIALYVLLLKLPKSLKAKLMGLNFVLDLAVTLILMLMFAGSYSGMVAAVFGGLIFSGLLMLSRALFGYEQPLIARNQQFHGHQGITRTRLVWIPVAPIWRRKHQ